jgi:hypothetical protein
MTKQRNGFLKKILTLGIVLIVAGLHRRPRGRNTSGTPDTPNRNNDGDGRVSRTHANSDAPVSTQQRSLTGTATGNTARPKTPGAPTPPKKRLPPGRKKKVGEETIVLDPDRDKPDTKWTKGFTENLDPPFQDDDGNWNINLRMHEGWNQADFDAKANYLQELGENGQLNKKTGEGAEREGDVDTWRSAKEREIFYEAQSQAELDAGLAELDGQQIDHAHELQLGGEDEHANMWAIDSATNHGMGGQINSQLSKVPDGAQNIKINIIPGVYTPTT